MMEEEGHDEVVFDYDGTRERSIPLGMIVCIAALILVLFTVVLSEDAEEEERVAARSIKTDRESVKPKAEAVKEPNKNLEIHSRRRRSKRSSSLSTSSSTSSAAMSFSPMPAQFNSFSSFSTPVTSLAQQIKAKTDEKRRQSSISLRRKSTTPHLVCKRTPTVTPVDRDRETAEGNSNQFSMSGYMWKRKRRRKLFSPRKLSSVWQKRYFELESGSSRLIYFHKKPGRGTRSRGAIDLSRVTRVALRYHNKFALIDLFYDGVEKDPYALKIDDKDEAQKWYEILRSRAELCAQIEDAISTSKSSRAIIHDIDSEKVVHRRGDSSSKGGSSADTVELVEASSECDKLGDLDDDDHGHQNFLNAYFDVLSEEQLEAVEQLGSTICSHPLLHQKIKKYITGNERNPHDNVFFMSRRVLAGRGFDVTKAMDAILEIVGWRDSNDIASLANEMSVKNAIGDESLRELRARHPVVCLGADLEAHRPIVFKYFGSACSIHSMINGDKNMTVDDMMTYHLHCQERAMRRLGENSKASGVNVEQFRVIMDATGWHIGLFSRVAARFLLRVAKSDQKYYIERMHSCWIINAPKTIALCWSVIRRWLDARTEAKVKIMRSKDEWFPVLKEHIPESSIPPCYGGSAKGPDAIAYSDAVARAGKI